MLMKKDVERLRKCAVEQPLVRQWIKVCDDWLVMADRRTWYEVSVVIGGLPPGLMSVPMQMVKKFDSEADAVKWADKFRGFLKTQERTRSTIVPTDEEIEFLGGNHCAIEFSSISERTKRKIA